MHRISFASYILPDWIYEWWNCKDMLRNASFYSFFSSHRDWKSWNKGNLHEMWLQNPGKMKRNRRKLSDDFISWLSCGSSQNGASLELILHFNLVSFFHDSPRRNLHGFTSTSYNTENFLHPSCQHPYCTNNKIGSPAIIPWHLNVGLLSSL